MAPRYLKPGQDFDFPRDFGFTQSATGRSDARNHPSDPDDGEYGDGSFVEGRPALAKEKAKGGPIRRAQGGQTDAGTPMMMRRTLRHIVQDKDGNTWEEPDNDFELSSHRNPPQVPAGSGMDTDPRATTATNAVDSGNYARGGRAGVTGGKPSTAHKNDPKGYDMGGPAQVPTGRPTGVPGMAGAPGMVPAAGPMGAAPPPMHPAASPLAQRQSGPLDNATMTIPVHDAARLAHGLVQAGRVGGIRQAIGNAAAARGAAMGRMAAMAPGAAGSPVAAPPQPPAQQGIPAMAHGGHITAAQRHRLPASEFGLPSKEAYPIDTPGRARSALSRASANASSAEQATIRRKVHARYPSIGKK